MEAFAAPLRTLSRWAAVFVRHRERRLLHVVASSSLREAAVKVVMAQEFHADNQSPFLRFDHPVPENDDGWVWLERMEALRAMHEKRRAGMTKHGIELPPLAVAPSSSRPLASFAMQLLQLHGTLSDPLHGLVLVLAPAAVMAPSLASDVAALLERPELPWLRCVVIEPEVSTLGDLPRQLGYEALQLGCVVDDEQVKREFARKVDASMAADPAAPGLAQVGAAWPRGVVPPARKQLPKPPKKAVSTPPEEVPFPAPVLEAPVEVTPLRANAEGPAASAAPARASLPGEPPLIGAAEAPAARVSAPPPLMGALPEAAAVAPTEGDRVSAPPPLMGALAPAAPRAPAPEPPWMGRISMEPPPPVEDFELDDASVARPAVASPTVSAPATEPAPMPPPSIEGLTSASFRKVRPMTLKAAQAMREGRPFDAVQIQRRVVYACQDAKRPREALVMELLLATYVVHGGDRDKGERIYVDVSDRAYAQTFYDLSVQALFAAAALRLLAKDHDGAAVLYGHAGAIGRDHDKPELGIEGFRMAGQLRAQNGHREQARRLFTEALSIGYGIPPGEAAQTSAPMAARQLAELCRRLGLVAQAESLERDAERLTRGEPPQGIREELG